jgi:DNA polymerase-3 subunit epsilon
MTAQLLIDDLGQALSDSVFVIVDLETTGGSPVDAGITEIGAVKVRGGEVIGEFQSLVNPGEPIPPFITALTGISDSTVADAPSLAGIFPSFLEFMTGATLVAHNASYDVGFLKGAAAKLGHVWPEPRVVDTVRMARAALENGEVVNRKLQTLATFFKAPVTPTHRALDDARATVHVFHALLERLAGAGVTRLDDLLRLGPRIAARRAAKRSLADDLPRSPGVYIFEDAKGRPLYIGKAKNVSSRVRSYFGAAETRDRMERMLDLTVRVRAIPCATEFEALIREHRLLVEHKPTFNRAGVRPERNVWLRLTNETFPRLSIVRERHAGRGLLHLGPFRSRQDAEFARDAIASVTRIRTCQETLSIRTPRSACALADMGRCDAPCDHRVGVDEYRTVADAVLELCNGDGNEFVAAMDARQRVLADAERFEEAAVVRDRVLAFVVGNAKRRRYERLAAVPQLVAAQLVDGVWTVHVIRFGKLAGAGTIHTGTDHREQIDAIVATASQIQPTDVVTAADVRETLMLQQWLEQDHVRLLDGSIATSLPAIEPLHQRLLPVLSAREQSHALREQERSAVASNRRL